MDVKLKILYRSVQNLIIHFRINYYPFNLVPGILYPKTYPSALYGKMLNQTLVKVRDKSESELNGTERVMTYKAFQYTKQNFELIGQCDEDGRLIPGNPNLHSEYRKTNPADAGRADDTRIQDQVIVPAVERKKPGPKPKSLTLTEETA